MDDVMRALAVLAWIVSLILFVRLLRSDRSAIEKLIGSLLLLVPILGPLLYQFFIEPPPPQHPSLRAWGPRGDYTHRWIVLRPVMERGLRRRTEISDKKDKSEEDESTISRDRGM
jgi:hypothetical protein